MQSTYFSLFVTIPYAQTKTKRKTARTQYSGYPRRHVLQTQNGGCSGTEERQGIIAGINRRKDSGIRKAGCAAQRERAAELRLRVKRKLGPRAL